MALATEKGACRATADRARGVPPPSEYDAKPRSQPRASLHTCCSLGPDALRAACAPRRGRHLAVPSPGAPQGRTEGSRLASEWEGSAALSWSRKTQ